jgi:hypothetical protein
MNTNSLMGWLVQLLVFLMILPFVISLAGQLLVAILPWLIGLAVIMGLVAGVSAALVMRRRPPPRNGGDLPPGGAPPVRRPRGRWHDDEE